MPEPVGTSVAQPFGSIDGKVALITGGASGIGRASAEALAASGALALLCDRDAAGAAEATEAIRQAGGQAEAWTLDLLDPQSVQRTVAEILARHGGVDMLVNCAGVIQRAASMFELDEVEWARIFRVNAEAPLQLTKLVAAGMIARGEGGRIVNVSSAAAFRAFSTPTAYTASKAALTAITRSAAAELAPHDINVNAVAPGVTATAIHQGADSEQIREQKVTSGPLANLLGRVTRPQDVAAAVLFLCMPGSRQITAQTLHVSGGAIV